MPDVDQLGAGYASPTLDQHSDLVGLNRSATADRGQQRDVR
jgi:hypothetical protein